MGFLSFGGRRNAGGGSGFRGGRMVIALVIVAISLISYYGKSVYNPVTEENQRVDLTVDQEIALGLQAAPEMAQQFGGESQDTEAKARVERIGRRIIERTKAGETNYQYHFVLLADGETINAFALPGGPVFMTEGLLSRLETDGEIAGVLGHEIGHVVARHGAEHLAKAKLTQGLAGEATVATYDPENPYSRQSAAAAMAVAQLVTLRFGREDELEADRLGVRFTSEAGYDPRSMVRVMEVLAEASRGGKPPEFFRTHPNPDRRVERITLAIRERYPNGVPDDLIK